jgi:chemotaxis protein CheD
MGALIEIDYILNPGFVYFSSKIASIRTVLGSCVAVCLWDKINKFGGMNHYLYPATKDKSKATPKYGNVATITLIKMMINAGSAKNDLIAQIFGGGHSESALENTMGSDNVDVAKKILKEYGIDIVSEDVGGTLGRKIIFDTSTGNVLVYKVQNIRKSDWILAAE